MVNSFLTFTIECLKCESIYKTGYKRFRQEIKDLETECKKLKEENLSLQQKVQMYKELSEGHHKHLKNQVEEKQKSDERVFTYSQRDDGNTDAGESGSTRSGILCKACKQCPKLEQKIKQLQDDIKDKDTILKRLSLKINADFSRHQGNSLEEGDVRSLWNELFVYEAPRDLPKDITYPQKIKILRNFCDMFMDISGSVQEELIERMADCLRALFTSQPSPEVFSETNLKEIQRAFSILVDIPKVKEDFNLLYPKMLTKFKETKQCCQLTNMEKFAQSALSLCVKMSKRVPPYITSNVEKHFVSEQFHEWKYVKGTPDPQEYPEVPVSYIRPIVYHNYRGMVFIQGMVVTSTSSGHNEDTAAGSSLDATNSQQPTTDAASTSQPAVPLTE